MWKSNCITAATALSGALLLNVPSGEALATGLPPTPTHSLILSDSANDAFLDEMTKLIPKLLEECVDKRWDFERPPEQYKWTWYGEWYKTENLDFIRGWWSTVPRQYRHWATCEDGHLRDRLFRAFEPMIARGESLGKIETLLMALLDTSRVTRSKYGAARAQTKDTVVSKVVAAAAALGDPHRYDHAFSNYIDMGRDEWLPFRSRTLALLGRLYLKQNRVPDALRVAMEARSIYRHADPKLPVEAALRAGDTLLAVRALAFCRVASYSCTSSQEKDSATYRQLLTLYRAVNRGSIEGVDTVLKAVLRDQNFQLPIKLEPRKALGDGSRVALIQYYTWAH
jgi:hypothetical protein